MKIAVKNFGPIKHGEIDLSKRFYVFVGHNNSGKTYMANLMWELMSPDLSNKVTNELLALQQGTSKNLLGIKIDKLKPKQTKKGNNEMFTFSQEQLKLISKVSVQVVLEELTKNFKIDVKHFIIDKAQVSLKQIRNSKDIKNAVFISEDYSKPVSQQSYDFYEFEKKEHNNYIEKRYIKTITDDEMVDILTGQHDYNSTSIKKDNNNFTTLLHSMTIPFSGQNTPFFLPSDRTFYPRYYKYLYSAIQEEQEQLRNVIINNDELKEKLQAEIIKKTKLPFKKSVNDLFTNLLKLNRKHNNHYDNLIKKLAPILSGDIVARSAEGIGPNEFRLKIEDEKELELYLSSSAANQLTTLYLYLKYWAKDKNNLLIIDEPEENLHPKNQLLLLNILMEFANMNNNRVVITTHSPLMAEAVNNHIQVAKLQDLGVDVEQVIRENGFDIGLNDNIRHKDFGVYFFGNETITPYDVDDYGVFFRDFKEEQRRVDHMANVFSDHIYAAINEEEVVNA